MKHMLMYAKIVDDKTMGLTMVGIYFGGVFDGIVSADNAARQCVANSKNGIIVPKVLPMENHTFQDTVSHAVSIFDRMADNVYESEKTINY